MTAAPAAASAPRRGAGALPVVDADFDIVPSVAETPFAPATIPLEALSVLSAPSMRPTVAKSAGPLFWLGGAAFVVMAFWVSGGHALLRGFDGLPFLAGPIVIASVDTRIESRAGRDLLMIDGEALNQSPATQTLPSIGVEVATPAGTVTRYTIGSAQKRLAAGETYLFSGRLRVPEEGVKSVSVTLNPLD